jgi:hypothetical protein
MEKKKRVYPHRPYQAVANLSKISDEQKEKVKELYLQGLAQSKIEQALKMTRKTIRTILKEAGIDRDKSTQWRVSRGSSLKEDVFDNLNPESLYWIGFLYADGHIRKDKEYSIEIEIELKDKTHLEKYKTFLGCNKEIKHYEDNSCSLKVYSKVIHSRLKELGFNNRKSWNAIPHPLLKESRDFWRGVVDGDGGVYDYKNFQMTLCGTLETIFDFIIFCSKETGIKDKYPSLAKKEGRTNTVLHQVHYYSEDCKKVLDLLYKDSTVYLERKYQSYLEIINQPEIN